MNREEAVKIAMEARQRFEVSLDFRPAAAQKRIIEIVEGHLRIEKLPPPGPTRDIRAWVITLAAANQSAEFAIDEDGEVVRVRRSR